MCLLSDRCSGVGRCPEPCSAQTPRMLPLLRWPTQCCWGLQQNVEVNRVLRCPEMFAQCLHLYLLPSYVCMQRALLHTQEREAVM